MNGRLSQSRAEKNLSAILKALASFGQARLAEKMGVSESLISRQKSEGHLAKTAEMLAHLGLKVVPEGVQCFDPEYVEHLRALAQLGLRQPSADQVLEWDE